ncbi:MAG TPA: hypothetical protein DIU01_01425 [Flavobacterium sp.]|nr:hypothetical protein [Flavobacterium sp.]
MEELDLLKKDWKKNENSFEQVSEVDIYKMLHKKSSSIVKWILIISILEFIVLNGISWLINDPKFDKFLILHPYLNHLDTLNYIVVIVFIYLVYKNYKSISVLNSSKTLIEHILKTRRVVTFYIYWNIIIGSIFGAFGAIDGFNDAYSENHNVVIKQTNLEYFIVIFFTVLILIGLVWLFYKLLYGNLLNRLSKNYNELKKIDL